MSEPGDGEETGATRRIVLKRGAAAAGALTLGAGTAAAGHGKTGGTMLVDSEPELGLAFHVHDFGRGTAMKPANCNAGNAAEKEYQGLELDYETDPANNAVVWIRTDKLKHLEIVGVGGPDTYEFTSKQECKAASGYWRASFKPI